MFQAKLQQRFIRKLLQHHTRNTHIFWTKRELNKRAATHHQFAEFWQVTTRPSVLWFFSLVSSSKLTGNNPTWHGIPTTWYFRSRTAVAANEFGKPNLDDSGWALRG
jgi:hypothetical protein